MPGDGRAVLLERSGREPDLADLGRKDSAEVLTVEEPLLRHVTDLDLLSVMADLFRAQSLKTVTKRRVGIL